MEQGRRRMVRWAKGRMDLAVAFALACLALWVMPGMAGALWICVEAEDSARVVASLRIEPEGTFSLRFINSIYLAPVKETYRYVPSEGIVAVLVESPSAGVFEYYGLVPDGSGASAVYTRASEIRVRSSDYHHHRLSTGGEEISLNGLVPGGEPLVIRVKETCSGVSP